MLASEFSVGQRPSMQARACRGLPAMTTRLHQQPFSNSKHIQLLQRSVKPSPSRLGFVRCAAASLVGGSDVVGDYTRTLTQDIRNLAEELKDFTPEKADEVLSQEEQQQIKAYINRYTELLLLEVDAEVQEFVICLKDWDIKWLQQDGRVLLGLSGQPAGDYYQQEAVRFYLPADSDRGSGSKCKGKKGKQAAIASSMSSDADQEWMDLGRHNLAPGDVVLLTSGRRGPLATTAGGWREDMLCGVIIERSRTSIKVAFDTAPDKEELEGDTWRLDKSVNTLTIQRALLGLAALWHRMPFEDTTWGSGSNSSLLGGAQTLKDDLYEFYNDASNENSRRQHTGIFEGSALSGVIVSADKSFDWSTLPSTAGGMPQAAIANYQSLFPKGSRRPDEAATAALLKDMEQSGKLGRGSPGKTVVDNSQLQAIATAVLNPLCLLHGPPGTGKTTTIGALLYFLRRDYGYTGRILATAQSNVAVDNMLETALRKGNLRVLRIGEPAKVRSCLKDYTLKAQLAKAVEADPEIAAARREQQSLRRKLRNSRRRGGEYMERLDELHAEIQEATNKICRDLLDSADVVGVTCTGAAGPELQHFAFDMVIIDEGSQASEPETLIPILKGSQRVVIVGDHKQLPPVIKSREAEAGGLSTSMFERLMHLGAPSAMLQVQYRSHPKLMDFINQQYYNNLLSNGVTAAARPTPQGFPFPNLNVPLVFVHVDGTESSSARGSKMNEKEASVLEDCVRHLVKHCGMQPGQLGVTTPYAAQVSLISKRLQASKFNINGSGSSSWDDEYSASDLEVKSVDGYQGREKDVIMLSTVRANSRQKVGFLDDWRRANVALSRARTALVVVGHMGTLRSCKTWGPFLQHAQDMGCVVQLQHLKHVLSSAKKR